MAKQSQKIREELWHRVAVQQLANNPERIVDLLDLFSVQWGTLGSSQYGSEYAAPFILDFEQRDFESLVGGAGIFGTILTTTPYTAVPGALIGITGSALDLWRKGAIADRKEHGIRLWEEDPDAVIQMIGTLPAYEDACLEIATGNFDPKLKEEALNNLKKIEAYRVHAGLPKRNSKLSALAGILGESSDALGFTDATKEAEKKADPTVDPTGYEAALKEQIKDLKLEFSDLKQLSEFLRAKLEGDAQEELEQQKLNDIRGMGALVGMLVSIDDPVRGKAITQLVDSAVTAYAAFGKLADLTKPGSIATLATGAGAVFTFVSALQSLGAGPNGPSEAQSIMSALALLNQKIDFLIDQVILSRQETRDFLQYTKSEFKNISNSINSVRDKLRDLEWYFEVSARDVDLSDVRRQLISVDTANTPEAFLSAFRQLFEKGVIDTTESIWTGADRIPSSACEVILANKASRGGSPLEECPDLFRRAVVHLASLSKGLNRQFYSGLHDIRFEEFRLLDELDDQLRQYVGDKECISPKLTGDAASKFCDLYLRTLLLPHLRPPQPVGTPLTVPTMLDYMRLLLEWPLLNIALLSTDAAVESSLLSYRIAAEALLEYCVQITWEAPLFQKIEPIIRMALYSGAVSAYGQSEAELLFEIYNAAQLNAEPDVGQNHVTPTYIKGDEETAFDALKILVALEGIRHPVTAELRPHWVDFKFDQPNQRGTYFETFEFHSEWGLIAKVYVEDRRQGAGVHGFPIKVVERYSKRGHIGPVFTTPQTSPGPFDDVAYDSLMASLAEFGVDQPRSSFASLKSKLHALNIEIALERGLEPRGVAAAVHSQVSRVRSGYCASAAPSLFIPPPILDNLRNAWIALSVSTLCKSQRTGRFDDYLDLLRNANPLLTEQGAVAANLSTLDGWKAVSGRDLANLTMVWRSEATLGLRALDPEATEEMYDTEPAVGARFVGFELRPLLNIDDDSEPGTFVNPEELRYYPFDESESRYNFPVIWMLRAPPSPVLQIWDRNIRSDYLDRLERRVAEVQLANGSPVTTPTRVRMNLLPSVGEAVAKIVKIRNLAQVLHGKGHPGR